jgi:DNA-binding NtrC family response regulator
VTPRGRILIVDDEAGARTALTELLRDGGYAVESAADGPKAMARLEDFSADLVLTDLRMPGMDGLQLMQKLHERDRELPVVVISAHGEVESAVQALNQGAADYLAKPVHFDVLSVVIERALERRRLRGESARLRLRLSERHRLDRVIGSSPGIQRVTSTVLQVAPSRATVLVTGESGTGKEMIGAAIHEHSPRSAAPFVKLHCAALSEATLEAELFGQERSSTPGVPPRRDGKVQQAEGGTLFLDEVSEIPPAVQVKLLRFLVSQEYERVGGSQTMRGDVRVVAATERDLQARVKEGLFREDLYYRLAVVSIEMPPLRSRQGDVGTLALHFMTRFARENGKNITRMSQEALDRLVQYSWPGNVRELENAVERAVVVCPGDTVRLADLAASIVSPGAAPGRGLPPIPGSTLAELERYAILTTLEHCNGSTSRCAEMLGISPRKIQYKLHDYSDGTRPLGRRRTPPPLPAVSAAQAAAISGGADGTIDKRVGPRGDDDLE